MKFLLDAHLPPGLRRIFADAGHDAIHTLDLPERNLYKDGALNTVSLAERPSPALHARTVREGRGTPEGKTMDFGSCVVRMGV